MPPASQPSLFPEPRGVPLGFTSAGPPEGAPAPTIVALHGGLVGGRLTFGPVLGAWSRRLRVLVPDRRGYERTPVPSSGTIEEQADDLLGFIGAHAAGRAHVVGASYGGVVALTALQSCPDAFRSLTLLESPALSLVAGDDAVDAWKAELQRTWERIDDEPEPILRRFLGRTDPGSLDALLRLLRSGDAGIHPVRDELRPWLTPLSPAGVRGTGVPALVCSGGRSAPIFRRVGDHVAALLGAEHLVIEDAGHALHLAGRRVLDPLRAHVARAEAAASATEPVRLRAHDARWSQLFAAERDIIAGALGQRAPAVEHIGSTAVPDLEAKPIIDIIVGVEDLAGTDELLGRLEAIGYSWWRDNPRDDQRFLLRAADGVRRFHVHVAVRGGDFWRRRIAFRDRLRADEEVRGAYAALKRELAATHRADREAYTDAKSAFVRAALAGTAAGPAG